jgi:hypothetical protein
MLELGCKYLNNKCYINRSDMSITAGKSAILLICVLFFLVIILFPAEATILTQAQVISQGNIVYTPMASPTPTSTPRTNNLATISFWSYPNSDGFGIGNPFGGDMFTYPVTWQGHSAIKMSRSQTYVDFIGKNFGGIYELDGEWVTVKPGDTIVFSAYFWTTGSTLGDSSLNHGVMLGADMYSGTGRICQMNNHGGTGVPDTQNYPAMDYTITVVPWNSGSWVHISMTWKVQSTYKADGFSGDGGYSAGTTVVPAGFIPWMLGFAQNTSEAATTYIYSTEIYVNP